nr:hypothetical protein HK105_000402 [Polyrhizophydium stewartii]
MPSGVSALYPIFPPETRELRIVAEIQMSNFPVDASKLTPEYFDGLTGQSQMLVTELIPSGEQFQMQQTVVEMVRDIAARVFPGCVAHHDGLMATGFDLPHMDLDICLSLPCTTLEYMADMSLCIEKLAGMRDVRMMNRSRVAICRMRDPITGLGCDISFHGGIPFQSLRLMQAYLSIDPRLQDIVLVVQFWAKCRCINEPQFGTLSSYCLMIMIVHVLQLRGVLPCLQTIYGAAQIGGVNCDELGDGQEWIFESLAYLPQVWTCSNTESVGELIVAFFKYYACEFPYVHGVASVRCGRVLSKEEKCWTKQEHGQGPQNKDRYWFCIEDPVEYTVNIGRAVDKDTLYEIRGEFIRASKILCVGPNHPNDSVLARVCERISGPGKRMMGQPTQGPAAPVFKPKPYMMAFLPPK